MLFREGRTVAYLHGPPRQSSAPDGHVFAPDLWRSLSSVGEGSDSGRGSRTGTMRFGPVDDLADQADITSPDVEVGFPDAVTEQDQGERGVVLPGHAQQAVCG